MGFFFSEYVEKLIVAEMPVHIKNILNGIHDIKVGDIQGITYIYSIMYRFGIIEVSAKAAEKMQLRGGLKSLEKAHRLLDKGATEG